MVLLGIGILLASLSFLAYSQAPARWWSLVRFWRQSQQTAPDGTRLPNGDRIEDDRKEQSGDGADEVEARSPETTPKASAQLGGSTVPRLALDDDGDGGRKSASMAPPPYPTEPRMAPPPSMAAGGRSPASLMPPPSVRPSALRPLPGTPSAASSLRIPPGRSLQASKTTSLPASTSTLPPSARPSRKVLLAPGHSPLDWAHLVKNPPSATFLRGGSLSPSLVRVTPSRLRAQNGRKGKDAWGTWQGKVYNLSPYLAFHPGGEGELMRGAGKADVAERLFMEVHPWVNWDGILGECLIGILVSERDGASEGGKGGRTDLEALD